MKRSPIRDAVLSVTALIAGAVSSVGCGGGGGGGGGGGVTAPTSTRPTVSFVVAGSTVTEGASSSLDVELRTSTPLTQPVTITVQASGSAVQGQDHEPVAGVTFAAGSTNGRRLSLAFVGRQDLLVEGTELAALTLRAQGAGLGSRPTHTVTLTDDDAARVAFASTATTMADESAVTLGLTITLTTTLGATLPTPATIDVAGGGTATVGSDYAALPATVTFPAGSGDGATQNLNVSLLADSAVELNETVSVSLAGASAPLTLGSQTTHTVTITDDDIADVAFALASSVTANEAAASHAVTITLITHGGTLPAPVLVDVASGGGTATAGADYQAVSTIITFAAGSPDGATEVVNLPVLADLLVEGDQTVDLTLSFVSGPAQLGARRTHTVTISDDHAAEVGFVFDSSATPDELEATHLIPALLQIPSGATLEAPLTVALAVVGGAASAGTDYTLDTTSLTFPAGAGDGTYDYVLVSVLTDSLVEGNESIHLEFSGGAPAVLGRATHAMSISDDEFLYARFAGSSIVTADEGPADHLVTVTLFDPSGGAGQLASDTSVTINATGTASIGADFTLPPTVTFPAGSSAGAAVSFSVRTLEDALVEGSETVVLTLSNGEPIFTSPVFSRTVTITDDDFVVSFASAGSVTADESAGPHPVVLVLLTDGATLGADVTVRVNSADGTALSGSDYVAVVDAIVTFPAGSGDRTIQRVDVTLLADTAREGDETLTLGLSGLTGPATIGVHTSHTLRLTEDDLAWQEASAGIDGGTSRVVAIAPTSPSVLYAGGTGTRGAGAYRSPDGGATWERRGVGLGGYGALSFVVDPATSDVVYAAAARNHTVGGGIYKTIDGGVTWMSITPADAVGSAFLCVARHPTAPATIYAGGGAVWRSTNAGVTWSRADVPGFASVVDIEVHPTSTQLIYAVTDGSGLFRSTDGGLSWSAINTPLFITPYMTDLEVDPATPATLYLSTWGGGIFKTNDAGATWSPTSTSPSFTVAGLELDPLVTTTIYAATFTGVYRSVNGGVSWGPAGAGLSRWVDDVAVDPTTSSTVYTAGFDGVWKSADSGASWTSIRSGVHAGQIEAIALDVTATSTLYCVDEARGVFKTTDAANSWASANAGLETESVSCLAIDPVTPTQVYAGVATGVYRSTDGAATWTSAGTLGARPRVLLVDHVVPTTVYACSASGVHVSADSGATWTTINTGLTSVDVNELVMDPTDRLTLYAGTQSAGVFKTTTAGAAWSRISTGLPAQTVLALAVDPATPSRLYVATTSGAAISSDGGGSWSRITAAAGLPSFEIARDVAIDPSTPTTVYVAMSTALFKSTDSGATWSPISNGLAGVIIDQIVIDPASPTTVYAASPDDGVFKTTTGGE